MNEILVVALKNWRNLNNVLGTFSESQVLELLNFEMTEQKRKQFLKRLHQRYTTLRAIREWKEINTECLL